MLNSRVKVKLETFFHSFNICRANPDCRPYNQSSTPSALSPSKERAEDSFTSSRMNSIETEIRAGASCFLFYYALSRFLGGLAFALTLNIRKFPDLHPSLLSNQFLRHLTFKSKQLCRERKLLIALRLFDSSLYSSFLSKRAWDAPESPIDSIPSLNV